MAATANTLNIGIGIDTSGLTKGFATARSKVDGFMGEIGRGVLQGVGIGSGLKIADGIAGGIGFIKDSVFDLNSTFEQQKLALGTLLGEDQAQPVLDRIVEFANRTPFELADVTSAFQKFLAVGMRVDEIFPLLQAVSDNAAAMGAGRAGIEQITRALFQMRAIGSAQMGEINQLSEAGVPMLDILAEHLGITGAGKVDPEKVQAQLDKIEDLEAQIRRTRTSLAQDITAGTAQSSIMAKRDTLTRAERELSQARAKLAELQAGTGGGSRTAAVRKMIENGEISAEAAITAYRKYIETKMPDMAGKQARTMAGAWTTIWDTLKTGIASAGQPVFELARDLSVEFSQWLQGDQFKGGIESLRQRVTELVAPFRGLWEMTRNISRDHGLNLLEAALTAVELKIGEAFGAGAQDKFHAFRDFLQAAPGAIGTMATQFGELMAWLNEKLPPIIDRIGEMKDTLIAGFRAMATEMKTAIGRTFIALGEAPMPFGQANPFAATAEFWRKELNLQQPFLLPRTTWSGTDDVYEGPPLVPGGKTRTPGYDPIARIPPPPATQITVNVGSVDSPERAQEVADAVVAAELDAWARLATQGIRVGYDSNVMTP